MKTYNEWKQERRFRASIYVDLYIPQTDNPVTDRAMAQAEADKIAAKIPNAYVGGVALYQPGALGLDREI